MCAHFDSDDLMRTVIAVDRIDIFIDFVYHLGHENLVELLLRKGSNINAEDENKQTPLHLAVEKEGKLFNICVV